MLKFPTQVKKPPEISNIKFFGWSGKNLVFLYKKNQVVDIMKTLIYNKKMEGKRR